MVSHEIQFVVYPILRWCDGLCIYLQLTLFESDLNLPSEMHISIKDRGNQHWKSSEPALEDLWRSILWKSADLKTELL